MPCACRPERARLSRKGAAAHPLAQGFCRDADAVGGHGVPPCADGAALRQFVQALPRSSSTKTVMWATQAARSLRLATRGDARRGLRGGAGAAARAGALVALCHRAARLWRGDGGGALPQASAWVLELPGARVTLGLSPEKARGSRARARCCIWSRAAMRMRTRRSCRRCWLSSRASISRSWPPGPVARRADRVRAGRAGVFRPGGVRSGGGRVLPSPAAGAGGAAGYVASPVGRGAQAGGRRRGAARRRGSTRCNRRSSATGSRWAPSPRKTVHLPTPYQGTRGPCKHTLAVRMFLDPLNAPGAGA